MLDRFEQSPCKDLFVLSVMEDSGEEDGAETLSHLYSSYSYEVMDESFIRNGWIQRVILPNLKTLIVLFKSRILFSRKEDL